MNPRYEILDSKDFKSETRCINCHKKITGKHLVSCQYLFDEDDDGKEVKVGRLTQHHCNDCVNNSATLEIEVDGKRKKVTIEDLIAITNGVTERIFNV